MARFLGRVLRDPAGISALEYILISGILMVVVGAAVNALNIEPAFQSVMDEVEDVFESAAGAD